MLSSCFVSPAKGMNISMNKSFINHLLEKVSKVHVLETLLLQLKSFRNFQTARNRVLKYTLLENKLYNLIRNIRKVNIQKRLSIAFLIISIVPVVFVGILSNIKYEDSINKKISSFSIQLMDKVSQNMQSEIEKYELLSDKIIMNEDIQEGMGKYDELADIQKNILLTDLTEKLTAEIYNFNNLKNIQVRLTSGQIFYNLGYDIYSEDKIENIIEETEKSVYSKSWTFISDGRGEGCIVLCRRINSRKDSSKKLGYVLLVIDEKVFAKEIYKNLNFGNESKVLFFDKRNQVMLSSTKEIEKGKVFDSEKLMPMLNKAYMEEIKTFNYKYKNKEYLMVYSYIPSTEWFLTDFIPISYINSESLEVRKNVVINIAIFILISLILSFIIYLSIYTPMKNLINYSRNVSSGKIDEEIKDNYDDEVGYLAANINNMVAKLKELISEVETKQVQKRNAELKMLQAQINPHFLFNTLNSIKWTAMLSGNTTVSDGLAALSELLKNTIINNDELVTLEDEIENIKNYAIIQRLRYGNSFLIHIDIMEEIKKCKILKFLLQPLVENSIIHGIDEENKIVDIVIKAYKEEGDLYILVKDNGKGFDMTKIESNYNKKGEISGIGISNVDERIKLTYGEKYGLSIRSEVGKMTEIIIKLVYMEEESHV